MTCKTGTVISHIARMRDYYLGVNYAQVTTVYIDHDRHAT